ncbi:MAG TPA: hypothetical protein VF998_10995 [Candidatus Limnocylindria bacterium]
MAIAPISKAAATATTIQASALRALRMSRIVVRLGRDRLRGGLLKLASAAVTLSAFVAGLNYAYDHMRSDAAPLHPPVYVEGIETPEPGTPVQPAPTLTLAPGLPTVTSPPITFTHVS